MSACMICCACGMRQRPRSGYCAQCDCPLGALAPPPSLVDRPPRPQRLPTPPEHVEALAAGALGCAALGWLLLPLGTLGAGLGVLLGSAALRRARTAHRHGALLRAWAALVLSGALLTAAVR